MENMNYKDKEKEESPLLLPFEKIKRNILVRKEAETSAKFGCDPNKRTAEELIKYGVVNINKPRGPTSHQVSAFVQQILKIPKAGHSGTLDPNVTGVLPIALYRATKTAQALLKAGKEYVGIMHIHSSVPEEKIKTAVDTFIGKITQLPPVRSAVKRVERVRNIYYFKILEIEDKDVLFVVGCQAGTYIRKLCHDIGARLGCGAQMTELRRTKAGPFKEDTLVTLQDLQDAFWYYKNKNDDTELKKIILPMERAVEHLPKIWILDTAVNTLCHGANLKTPGISKVESEIQKEEIVAVFTLKNELVALGIAQMTSSEMLKAEKGLAVRTDKVFMEPGVYPRIEKR